MATNYYIELGGGGGGSTSLTIGNLDSAAANAQGLAYSGGVLSTQSADATHPGMVNITTQTLAGAKTFSSTLTVANLINSGLTASTVPYVDGSKQMTSSAVTPTELGYVSGVTSAIQTQLAAKQATITIGSVDAAANATVLTLSAGTLSIQSATTARAGIVTAAAQNFDGAKTFISTPVFSAGFTSSAASAVNGSADAVQLTVKGNGTQTANLQNWTNSTPTVLMSVLPGGALYSPAGGSLAIPAFSMETGTPGKAGMAMDSGAASLAFNGTSVAAWTASAFVHTTKVQHNFTTNINTPSFYFLTENLTGFYRSAANAWGFTNAGTQSLDLAAALVTLFPATKIGADSTTPQHTLNTVVKTNGASAGTITNAPSAGNPTGFIQITINGTTSYIPYWQ